MKKLNKSESIQRRIRKLQTVMFTVRGIKSVRRGSKIPYIRGICDHYLMVQRNFETPNLTFQFNVKYLFATSQLWSL